LDELDFCYSLITPMTSQEIPLPKPSLYQKCTSCGNALEKGAVKPTALILFALLSSCGLVIAGFGYLTAYFLGSKPEAGISYSLTQSNQTPTTSKNFRILGDTFSGYSAFRNSAFSDSLKVFGLNVQYANEFDQAKRAIRLSQGQVDILVTTLDQFLKQKPAGKIVGLIARTVGADAVVLNTKQFPQLRSLLDVPQLVKQFEGRQKVMIFAGDTQSEYLGMVLDAKFEAFNLSDFELAKVGDASQAWKKMQNLKENVAIAILWEPYVTQARKQGNTVVLSSQDTPNTIVDVIVASDRLIELQPEKITQFLDAYYHRIDRAAQESAHLQKEIAEDGNLSAADAATVLKGINFFTSLETQRWMTDGTLEKRIGSTAAILTLSGKLAQVPAQPKSLFSDRFIKGAIANTQKLIDLVRTSDPQLAARLENRQVASTSDKSLGKVQMTKPTLK
jgi:OmpA-OmpF porin, OOP family